jgi:hypothetical protein
MLKEAPMIELAKSPSTRVPSRGRRAIWLAILLVFAALVFAAGAQAQATNAPDTATEGLIGEAATESGASPEQAAAAEEAPSTVEEPPAAAEEAPSTVEEPPAAAEEAPSTVEEPPLAAEQTPPPTGTTPPTGEADPPPTEQAPPVAETTPPADEAPAVAETKPPTTEHVDEASPPAEKKTAEQAPGGDPTGEADSEGSGAQRTGGSSQSAGASGPAHNDDTTGEAALGAPSVATASTTPDVLSEIPAVQNQPSLASASRTAAVHHAAQAGCEPAAIGASIAAGEVGGWLGLVAAASVSSTNFVAGETSRTAITAGVPAGSRGGGSAVENHPSAPTPGPGPGGAGGGSAAAGASGSASSASFTLVGILLQAAPRAIRRFRLAQPSWRTSFFVLIPERPD